jgi:hypothetical protein
VLAGTALGTASALLVALAFERVRLRRESPAEPLPATAPPA